MVPALNTLTVSSEDVSGVITQTLVTSATGNFSAGMGAGAVASELVKRFKLIRSGSRDVKSFDISLIFFAWVGTVTVFSLLDKYVEDQTGLKLSQIIDVSSSIVNHDGTLLNSFERFEFILESLKASIDAKDLQKDKIVSEYQSAYLLSHPSTDTVSTDVLVEFNRVLLDMCRIDPYDPDRLEEWFVDQVFNN